MTSVLTEFGRDRELSATFKAGADIGFGLPVKLSAANTVVVGTATDSIGWAVPSDDVEAKNEQESYLTARNDLVLVKLKGEVLNVTAGTGGVAVGNFVKGAASGKYVAEATPTTKTVATEGIALDAASADAKFRMLRLS